MKKDKRIKKTLLQVIIIVSIALSSFFMIKNGITNILSNQKQFQENLYLGQYYVNDDNFTEAEMYFKEALVIDENNEEAMEALIASYILQEKYEEAEKHVLSGLQEYPQNAHYHILLGQIKKAQKKFDEAKESFIMAKKLSFKNKSKYQEMINIVENLKSNSLKDYDIEEKVKDDIKEFINVNKARVEKKIGDRAIAYKILAQATTMLNDGQVYEMINLIESQDDKIKEQDEIKEILAKAYMTNYSFYEAQEILEEIYSKSKDKEIALLLSEVYIWQLKDDNFTWNNNEDNSSYTVKINEIEEKIYEIKNSSNPSEKKINSLNKKIEELEEKSIEERRNKIVKKINKVLKSCGYSLEAVEKQAKANFTIGNNIKTKELLDKLLVMTQDSNKSEINRFFYNTYLNQQSFGSKDFNNLINENKNFFFQLNKYLPHDYLNKEENLSWQKYFVNYFIFDLDKIKILKVDTSAYPIIDVAIRGNSEQFIKGKLRKRYLEVFDSGERISDYKLIKGNKKDTNIILLIDTSGSMAGNRLRVAKRAACEFVNNMGKDENIMFAGFSSQLNIKTDFLDYSRKQELIDSINGIAQGGGTNIYGSLNESLDKFSDEGNNIIVIMTDGEDDSDGLLETVNRAKQKNVPIFSIGLDAGYGQLQRISSETGAQFFLANHENQLIDLYSCIRDQFKNNYSIKFEVKNSEKLNRIVRIKHSKADVQGVKVYNNPKSTSYDIKDGNIELSSKALDIKTIYKNIGETEIIKVSLNGINNNITEVFIDEIFIDKDNWKVEDGKLVITIPRFIPKGNYVLNLWDESCNKYVVNNSITIKEPIKIGKIKIGNVEVWGDISNDDLKNNTDFTGDFNVNDMAIHGEISVDMDKGFIHGNGMLSKKINGETFTITRGEFEIDCINNKVKCNSGYESVYKNIRLDFREIDFSQNTLKALGYMDFRTIDENVILSNRTLEYCLINEDDVEIKLKNFQFDNGILRIENGELLYKNGKWIGKGEIIFSDSLHGLNGGWRSRGSYATGEADYELMVEEDSEVYKINKININFNNAEDIEVNGTGIRFTPISMVSFNPLGELSLNKYIGESVYSKGIGDKPIKGSMNIIGNNNGSIKLAGQLKNEYAKFEFDGMFETGDNFFGYSKMSIMNENLGEFTGEGNVSISDKFLFGRYIGETNNNKTQEIEISNNYISFEDKDGNRIQASINGKEDMDKIKELTNEEIEEYKVSMSVREQSPSSAPSKVKINNIYKVNNRVVIEPETDDFDNVKSFRIYEVDQSGNENRINYLEKRKGDYLTVNNDIIKKFKISCVNYNGDESVLSDVIDTSDLTSVSAIFDLKWNPEEEEINIHNVSVDLEVKKDSSISFIVNGIFVEENITESNKCELSLLEGGNEINISGNNREINVFDQIFKNYVVDSRAPLIQLSEKYDNKIVKDRQIIIGGKTETGSKLLLNNHEIDIDENGNFAEEVKLKFGKKYFQLIVEDAVNNKSINTIEVKYYGNIMMYLFGGFGVLYIVTISIFALLYRRKKRIKQDSF